MPFDVALEQFAGHIVDIINSRLQGDGNDVKGQVKDDAKDKDQAKDQMSIIIVCKDVRDWIDPKTKSLY